MADLPKDRPDGYRVFGVTGVDFCGPFFYKPAARNKAPVKCNQFQELKRLFLSDTHQKAVKDFCLADSIEWHFIPPRSPHFGGVGGCSEDSEDIYRCVGPSVLTYDELRTLVCNIAAVVNSRPLVSISEHPSDIDVLTPAHFLNGGPPSSFSEPSLTGLNFNRLDAWQHVSYLQQVFWTRWRDEYLKLLHQRAKWRTSKPVLAVGNIVLVKD
ncbi:uncharacterized protein LOC122757820 [Drosophila mojavensis]|uniref:uncharacterized protein LOC122757820 n=1 Tax=Drosophila mojavensis TaxID=7230 RepID=UPI001CD14247|nr:uncharacterized protein LOC122757820 [Drosophila mojavensis]